eukprot:jgi/Picsp_1/2572/NSC_00803-R1_wd-40 repeat protein
MCGAVSSRPRSRDDSGNEVSHAAGVALGREERNEENTCHEKGNEGLDEGVPRAEGEASKFEEENRRATRSVIEKSSSSDEELESFQGWRSSMSHSTDGGHVGTEGASTRGSGSCGRPSDSHGAPSSSGWLGQRPSTDTPLKPGFNAVDVSGGSSGQTSRVGGAAQDKVPGEEEEAIAMERRSSVSMDQSQRTSASSASGGYDAACTGRSSFVLERADRDANRKSLEAFQHALGMERIHESTVSGFDDAAASPMHWKQEHSGYSVLESVGIPKELCREASMLVALPPHTPAPACMLRLLWGMHDAQETEKTMMSLASLDLIKVAHLPDGQVWGLPQPKPMEILQQLFCHEAPLYHGVLIRAYATHSRNANRLPYKDMDERELSRLLPIVPNDGYVVPNLSFHLIAARFEKVARRLLLNPSWLERKFKETGASGVVSEFRRYLCIVSDKDIKLILQAFEMSVGVLTEYRDVSGLLRSQLVGRLLLAPLSTGGLEWLDTQKKKIAKRVEDCPPALCVKNPSLDQAGGLQRLCLKGHQGSATHVMITPSGTEAISCSSDGTARVWDLEIGDCMLQISGHAGPITSMAITGDGSLLVTSSEDGTMRVYELEKGQCLRVLAGHDGPVMSMVVDPFGRFVVSSGQDKTLRFWDLASARVLKMMNFPSPVVAITLSSCNGLLLLGLEDGCVHLMDAKTGVLVSKMEGHSGKVTALEFLQDTRRCISASEDGTIRIWSSKKGRNVKSIDCHDGASILVMKLLRHGDMAVTGSDDGTAKVWDLKTCTCTRVMSGQGGWVMDIDVSSKEDCLITSTSDGVVLVWNIDSGELLRVLEGHSGAVGCVQLTKKGRFAITGSEDCNVRVWDLAAPSSHIPKWHAGRIRSICGGHGIAVATAGDDCMARIWDVTSGECMGILKRHSTPIRWVFFSDDGSRLMTCSPDRQICSWDMESKEIVSELPAHQGSRVKSISASGDLSRAVVCLFDSTVSIWNIEEQQIEHCIQKWGQRDANLGHTSAVNEVLMYQDASKVLTVSKDYTARMWEISTGACIHCLEGHQDSVIGAVFDEKTNRIATYALDDTVRVWNASSGELISMLELGGKISLVSLSERDIAVAMDNGNIAIAPINVPEEIYLTKIHKSMITGLQFVGGGKYLASSSMDGTVKVLDTVEGTLQAIFIGDCGISCFECDEIRGSIIAGTDRGVVYFIDDSVLH